MAEAIAYNVVANLITKLGAVAFNEISSVYGVEDELGKLKDTLSTIEAALLDADQMKAKSHLMKDWIRKLNDAVYDADDLLDAFSTKALQRQLNTTDGRIHMKKVREFFSSSNQLAFRYKLGRRIKEISERFNEIAANMSKFNFMGRLIVQASVDNSVRETDSFVLASEITGRDKDKEEIIKLIMCSSNKQENVSVIPIIGIGGLGKTTLTQLVYGDERVAKYFELKLWVCVSEGFEKKTLVKKMLESLKLEPETKNEVEKLESLTKNEMEKSELDQLQIRLRQKLDGKRYLLVLDDVWNEKYEKWVPVKNLLAGGAKGSKIVVSTRSGIVASVMGTDNSYILKGLTEDQSWTLFEKLAFRGHEKVPPNLEVIGKELTEKCKGVPLAIRSLASVMQSKTQESEWLSIRNSDVWSLCQDDGDILPILKLSYDQLPIQLRQCFAYCSIFSKDYVIQKEVLIQLWMAQGYVQSSNNIECLEDIGDQYFRNLSSRSFFQDAKVNDDNEVTSCKMHDLVHDLATRVAGSDCAIAKTYVDNISNRVHHVSIAYPFEELPRQILKAKGLRTFLPTCDHDDPWYSQKASITRALMSPNFTCLRVLDAHSCGVRKVPSSVGKLQHLRYLDLSTNYKMTSLPNSICKLANLQTLKLSDCDELKRLPEGITKLINLRYLVIDGCQKLEYMSSEIGKLTSLRRLNKFVVGGKKWNLRLCELNGLNELRGDISIEGLENAKNVRSEAKEANLMGKQYLHSLTLEWKINVFDEFDRDLDEILLEGLQPHPKLRELSIQGYSGKMFSSWMMRGNIIISLPNIVRITLEYCDRCEHLPPSLDQLPSLKFLKLQFLKGLEHINDDNSNNHRVEERKSSSTSTSTAAAEGMSVFFPSLKELWIEDLPRLKGWWRGAGTSSLMTGEEEERASESSQHPSFPRLTTLKILNCPKLTSMPNHSSNHLEELYLDRVPEKLVRQLLLLLTTSASATTSSSSITEEGSASSSSSSISSLSKLKSLTIRSMESLPEEEVFWKNLSSLDEFVLNTIRKIHDCPVELQQLTTLQHLKIYIYDCPGLMALPDCLSNLTSLQGLYISNCPGLMALPDWLSNLTSLQSLHIRRCPLLSERCQKETGEDWSNISHIPYISIDNETIQH